LQLATGVVRPLLSSFLARLVLPQHPTGNLLRFDEFVEIVETHKRISTFRGYTITPAYDLQLSVAHSATVISDNGVMAPHQRTCDLLRIDIHDDWVLTAQIALLLGCMETSIDKLTQQAKQQNNKGLIAACLIA
jgi:hypothetical protein